MRPSGGRIHVTFRLPGGARRALDARGIEYTICEGPAGQPRKDLVNATSGCAALVTLLTNTVDADLMDAIGGQLKVVANLAVGFDNGSLDAAHSRGITVTNTPGVLDGASAGLTLALLVAPGRRVLEANRFLRSGAEWVWKPDLSVGLDISSGATLGIVGLGRIGIAFARRAAAFDLTIIATGSGAHSPEASDLGAQAVGLAELLVKSDVVSLHCPVNSQTKSLPLPSRCGQGRSSVRASTFSSVSLRSTPNWCRRQML